MPILIMGKPRHSKNRVRIQVFFISLLGPWLKLSAGITRSGRRGPLGMGRLA